MTAAIALATLFVAAFLAATLVPLQSEVVFVGMQVSGVASVGLLVLVASLGNTLGAFVTYAIGRGALRLPVPDRWRPDPWRMDRARGWWTRYGVWSLLLTWAPLGDVLALAAGTMRTPLWQFAVLVGLAKTGRYIVLAAVTAAAQTAA